MATTTTCDACGTRYAFTSIKDRCPICCPKPEPDDVFVDYELVDEVYYGDDWLGFSSCHADRTQYAAYLERHKPLTDAERASFPGEAFEPAAYVE